MALAVETTLDSLRADVVVRLNAEIELVSVAMKRIPIACMGEAKKFLTVPVDHLMERLPEVSRGLGKERDVDTSRIDFATPVVAALVKRAGPKRAFTVALLMMHLEKAWTSVSFRAVYEFLLEDAHGTIFNPDEVLYSEMPEPNLGRDLYPGDVLVAALVVYVNIRLVVLSVSPQDNAARSNGENLTVWGGRGFGVTPDVAFLSSIVLDRSLVAKVFFEKLPEMDHIRKTAIDCMRRVTPSAFVKVLSDCMPEDGFNFLESYTELRGVIDGLLWPDLLKFIELLYRRFDAATRQPVANYATRTDIYDLRLRYRLDDNAARLQNGLDVLHAEHDARRKARMDAAGGSRGNASS